MMAHKFSKGPISLFMVGSSSLRVRPFAPTTTERQARRTLDHPERGCRCQSSWCSPHTRRPVLNRPLNVARYPREFIDLVPAASSPISCQWQGGRGPLHGLTPFSTTAYLTPRSHQWEGVQVLEEDCLQGNSVSRTADTSLISRKRQEGQNSRQPTAMPRCGYDTTNMHVAANPRPAASAGGSGHPRNDKPRSGGKSDGGSGSGSGGSGRGEGSGRDDDDKGSKETTEQDSGRGSKDGEMTTEELIKTIDNVRLPMEGRGWTFWL